MNSIKPARIQSIDLVRGLAMIVMALDHCRDFLHFGESIDQDPLNFATTTPILFLTRWISHFCAPVFVMLSGTSIFLYSSKGKTKKQVAIFLFTRGLWLMLIEVILIEPIWDFTFSIVFLQVIWAIGLAMVVLSLLQFLPYRVLLALGLIIVFGHNLLDSIIIDEPFWKSVTWAIIHQSHFYQVNNHFVLNIKYPFLPWLGLMLVGYSLGKLYLPGVDANYRRKLLRTAGIGAIVLFIALRLWNYYGDMYEWASQKTTIFTLLDFVNTTKYPPSLLYMLMTIGPALVLLSYVENLSNSISDKIVIFGKVPFFYYILHVALIHFIAVLAFLATGHSFQDMVIGHFREAGLPYGSGHPLWFVYFAWIAVIIILYFPCRWYSRYKATHKQWWLSYV